MEMRGREFDIRIEYILEIYVLSGCMNYSLGKCAINYHYGKQISSQLEPAIKGQAFINGFFAISNIQLSYQETPEGSSVKRTKSSSRLPVTL